MSNVAFCGLGQMGAPMAARLLEAGHDLTVWNRNPDRASPIVARGARRAATPAEAAAEAEIAVTMLADPSALDEVVFGDGGLAAGLLPGATLVDMSTVGPAAVRDIGARLPEAVHFLDAPVLGSVGQALDGSLRIFVGGDPATFDRWRPLLAAMGTPSHLGPHGAGASMKLVANSTLGALMCGLAEALALADAFGLDEVAVLDILAGSPIGRTVESKRPLIEGGSYQPANFKLSLAAKDLGLVVQAAEATGIDLRLAVAARAWFDRADSAGLGSLDYSAVIAAARGTDPGAT